MAGLLKLISPKAINSVVYVKIAPKQIFKVVDPEGP